MKGYVSLFERALTISFPNLHNQINTHSRHANAIISKSLLHYNLMRTLLFYSSFFPDSSSFISHAIAEKTKKTSFNYTQTIKIFEVALKVKKVNVCALHTRCFFRLTDILKAFTRSYNKYFLSIVI